MSIDIPARAEGDIEVAADDIGRWNPAALPRFFALLTKALDDLERMPYLAARYEPESPLFPGLRVYDIPRDYGYLVCYFPRPDGISVARVLHHSRNFPAIFNPAPDPP